MLIKEYTVEKQYEGLRVDQILPILEEGYSRVYFSFLIKKNKVHVNDKEISPSYRIKEGDIIKVEFKEKEGDFIKPLEYQLDVVYEDEDVLVINKPQGLVVHPSVGHQDDTLVNALVYNNYELSTINGKSRVGIVHRIDKDTSGLLLVCKNDFAHNDIADQLRDHSMNREYIALVDGVIEASQGKIVGAIGRDKTNRMKMAIDKVNGKEAVTHFEVLKKFDKYTLILCKLETGRTHQIRVHMSSINHPLVGDKVYGGSTHLYDKGQMLHAYKLTFTQPHTKKEVVVEIPLPEYFQKIIDELETKTI